MKRVPRSVARTTFFTCSRSVWSFLSVSPMRESGDGREFQQPAHPSLLRLDGDGDVDRRRVDRAGANGRETKRALAAHDDLHVLVRVETEVPHRRPCEIVHGAGERIDADGF